MGLYERQQKEKKILEAAIRLFGDQGFEATKVSDVAKQAKISKGLVYFYFKSKENLYMAISKRGFDELKEVFNTSFIKNKDKSGIEVIAELVEGYFDFIGEKKCYHEAILHFLKLLDEYNHNREKLNPMILESPYFNKLLSSHHDLAKMGIRAISLGIKDGSMRPDLQAETTFYTLWSMLLGKHLLDGSVLSEPKVIKINSESWRNGFLKLFFEILKGSQQQSQIKPIQGRLF
ncbi:MAG: TetR/AcrR family transcriptional regulator [Cyclobacteriaceae bacterium]